MNFYKITGSGNDFVIVNNLAGRIPNRKKLAVAMCRQKYGVGADGLLLLEKSKIADYRMRIFNPDGSEALMCGNGLRCIVRYIREIRLTGKDTIAIETGSGVYKTIVRKENIAVEMFIKSAPELYLPLKVDGKRLTVHFVDTGVPHAVIVAPSVEKVQVAKLGPAIRYHERFAPGGTNVDWIEFSSMHRCKIRTYERGVEGETLSCGTGTVACVVCGVLLGKLRSPVEVEAKSGEILKVSVSPDLRRIMLEGKTSVIFRGLWLKPSGK